MAYNKNHVPYASLKVRSFPEETQKYRNIIARFMAGAAGIEPATYGFGERTRQYNQFQPILVNSVYLLMKRELVPINSNCL